MNHFKTKRVNNYSYSDSKKLNYQFIFSMVLSTTILLAFGALTLSVMLILTIAYLWIYLGHYSNITVGVKPTHAPHTDKIIAYKGTLSSYLLV